MKEKKQVTQLREGVDALQAFLRVHDLGLDRSRPYIGQRHTVNGERGTQRLPPITLRDLADVIVATLRTCPEGGEYSWRAWDDNAVAQNICVALEENYPEHFRWLIENKLMKERP